MKKVIIESPFAGNAKISQEEHVDYARAAMKHCLLQGESPYASHLLYTQEGVLDDTDPVERDLGMKAGMAWYDDQKIGFQSVSCVVYTDYGISNGMRAGIKYAQERGITVEYRTIPGWKK